ncbi:hypothetical protein Slin15195_G061920 [Septoria linicola]|uniref:Uncharacterized protein n=1 Tax=Septoria linicola TaxID=215465 RepID=A0A9Q9AVI4_9PEZI|nr:hypothetical protein Slin15195_G061920 [Septoria linicola]
MPRPSDLYHRGDGIRALQIELQEAIAKTQHSRAQNREQRAKLKAQLRSAPKTAKGRAQMENFLEACHQKKEELKERLMEQQEWRMILDESRGYDTELRRKRIVFERRLEEWSRRAARKEQAVRTVR